MDAAGQPEKLYSRNAISVATFIGGPIAAGILVRRNFINLGNPRYGELALGLNILVLLGIIIHLYHFSGGENERLFYPAVPALHTTLIYILVEVFQGKQIREHKVNKLAFYSAWKATGVGLICTSVFIGAGFTGYLYDKAHSFDMETYEEGITHFAENENIALRMYTHLEDGQQKTAQVMIKETGIPNWIRNIEIIQNLNTLENMPEELIIQNQILLEYCQLRMRAYGLIGRAIEENSSAYDTKISLIHIEIERLMDKLEKESI